MSGRTLDDFFEDAAAFSALSDEDKTLLMAGGVLEGETDPAATAASEESSEAPAAANVDTWKMRISPSPSTSPPSWAAISVSVKEMTFADCCITYRRTAP